MSYASCSRCREPGRTPFSRLNRQGVTRTDSAADLPPPDDGGRALCLPCHNLLCTLTLQPGSERPTARPLGAPSGGSPEANGEWACRLCGTNLPARAVRLECEFAEGEAARWVPIILCRHCDLWLNSLLRDGRAGTSGSLRTIDGGYGSFPHPQLTGVTVEATIANSTARSVVASVCFEMGVEIVATRGSIGITELGGPLPEGIYGGRPELLLVAPQQAGQLSSTLSASTVDWLTIPVTPQQVSSALTRAARPHALVRWDGESGLPQLDLSANMRPVLRIEPLGPRDRQPRIPAVELAWLLKRFARGYDQVGIVAGAIVFLPRVELRNLDIVADRLRAALGDVCFVHQEEATTLRPRLDVSG